MVKPLGRAGEAAGNCAGACISLRRSRYVTEPNS